MEFINDLAIIWKFLSKYKRKVYIIFLVALFASAIETAIPYIYGRIVDMIIANEEISFLAAILVLWLVLSFVKDWGYRFVTREGGIMGVACAVDLIALLHSHVLRLNVNFHKEQKSGRITSRYIRASDNIELVIREVIFWFGLDLLTVVLVYLVIIFIEWRIALVLGITIIVYFIVTVIKIKNISALFLKVIESYEEGDGIMHDATSNIEVVKTNLGERYEDGKAWKSLTTSLSRFTDFARVWSSLDSYQQTIISIGTVSIFSLIILFYREQSISIGQIVTLVGYLALIFVPLRKISISLDIFRRSMNIIRRALKLLEEEEEPYVKKGALKPERIGGEIEFRNVCFNYQETREILKNISFKVKAGQVIALVGESGVGKSTLVDLVSRYNIPTSGKIFLDGVDMQKIELEYLRKQIAVVPQEVSLFNNTLRHNVIYAKPDATDEEIWKALEIANAKIFVDRFPLKLDQEVGERGIKLSTGQKQRVAIARAVLRDPKILILDEATSALDSHSEKLVQDALRRLIKGRTTIVVAHRLSTIMHADKILVLEKGEIVDEGKHAELIGKGGLYYKLFTLQSLSEDKSTEDSMIFEQ